MAYPTTWDTFSTKGAGDTIMAAHVNALQTSLIATQEKLGSGTPLTASTNTALLGTGESSTGYQVISLANTSLLYSTTGRNALYTSGGDQAAVDTSLAGAGTLTQLVKSAWTDLDLSGIVGATTRLVLLRLTMESASAAGLVFWVRTNGNANAINVGGIGNHVANIKSIGDTWVITDASGIIEYFIDASASTATLTVGAWI